VVSSQHALLLLLLKERSSLTTHEWATLRFLFLTTAYFPSHYYPDG
jgi:hypothetical protein